MLRDRNGFSEAARRSSSRGYGDGGAWQHFAGELGYVSFFPTITAGAAADMAASLSVVVGLLACTKSIQRLSGPPLSLPLSFSLSIYHPFTFVSNFLVNVTTALLIRLPELSPTQCRQGRFRLPSPGPVQDYGQPRDLRCPFPSPPGQCPSLPIPCPWPDGRWPEARHCRAGSRSPAWLLDSSLAQGRSGLLLTGTWEEVGARHTNVTAYECARHDPVGIARGIVTLAQLSKSYLNISRLGLGSKPQQLLLCRRSATPAQSRC